MVGLVSTVGPAVLTSRLCRLVRENGVCVCYSEQQESMDLQTDLEITLGRLLCVQSLFNTCFG